MKIKIAALAALLTSTSAYAQAGKEALDLSGSVRLRYETIEGQLRPGFNRDDDLFNIRTTLRAAYAPGPLHVVGEIYDSRVDGENARTPVGTSEVNTLELVQAYVGADLPDALGAGSKLTVDAGRMLLNIASRRLVAADDYRNTINSYTGVRAEFSTLAGWRGTLIYVLPQTRLPDDLPSLRRGDIHFDRESFDTVIWGGTVSRAKTLGSIAAEASYYHFGEDDAPGRPTRNRSLDTYGGRLFRDPKPGSWDIEVESFRQTGSLRASTAANAAQLGVRAWFLHADSGYTFTGGWKPRLSIDFDLASGDRPGHHFGRFDTLYGMRGADFSPSGIFASIGRANIVSPGVRIEATPSKRTEWFFSYRPMWLEAATDSFSTTGVRDATGASGSFAGHQYDGRLRYWIVPAALRFEVDGVLIANGRFLMDAPNGSPRHTAKYLSLNLTSSF